jgi:hypothetical protein
MRSFGRAGSYPSGDSGLAIGVTVCNVGTGDIGWNAPMNPDHPMYAPLVVRLADDRIEQVSDWSFVKHGFLSINANFCGTCRTSNGNILGPNCSDTYGAGLNADRYWLGPPSEIDPWLGAWSPVGSLFDRGIPDVGFPQNQDGSRSLSRSMSDNLPPTAHRVLVHDQDLLTPNARYFYGMYIVVAGEPGGSRDNNWVFREARPGWTGSAWTFANLTQPINGTPLQSWPGASVQSGSNGNDDGYFYVAVKVGGPDARGFWHYEYAVQNRDNHRGGASFRLPICPDARVTNLRFRDIDGDATTDWTARAQGGEIAFFAPPATNPLEWNTIYNFSFDADVAPSPGTATIDQARAGAGALAVTVPTSVPGLARAPVIGAGCGAPAPSIFATGSPAIASIPNPGFGLRVEDVAPNSSVAVLVALQAGDIDLGNGCRLYLDLATAVPHGSFAADGQGVAQVPFPVPNDPSLEGASLAFQAVELVPGGPLYGQIELSHGLLVRIGNQPTGCR